MLLYFQAFLIFKLTCGKYSEELRHFWFGLSVLLLTEVSEVSFALTEYVGYSQCWKRVFQIYLGISSKPTDINTHVYTMLPSHLVKAV